MIRVAAAVTTDEPHIVSRAAEALGRAAAGLGLEGVTTVVVIETVEGDG